MTRTAAAWIVHRAGPLTTEGLQLCTRCTLPLLDLSQVTGLDRPLAALGWSSGTLIARLDGDAIVSVPHTGALLPDMAMCKAMPT